MRSLYPTMNRIKDKNRTNPPCQIPVVQFQTKGYKTKARFTIFNHLKSINPIIYH